MISSVLSTDARRPAAEAVARDGQGVARRVMHATMAHIRKLLLKRNRPAHRDIVRNYFPYRKCDSP